MPRSRVLVLAAGLCLLAGGAALAADRRPLSLDDLARLREVSDPQISPDGNWVAYTVSSEDVAADQNEEHVWMTSWDGTQSLRLTAGKGEESDPVWSPDGRFLAFLSDRGDENDAKQLWILALAGGEAERITEFKGGVTDLAWSPDGKRLVLVVDDPDPDAPEKAKGKDSEKPKTPKPIVIDRFYFKEDVKGYLTRSRSHLYLVDRETHKSEALTSGEFDELLPSWSPDGSTIAFVSKRGADFDRTENWDVFVIEARAGATARTLTTYDGPDEKPDWESRPAWSPDGKWIAYLEGGPARMIDYAVHKLAVVPAAGGAPRILTPALDRNVQAPRFTPDGASILFLVEDDRAFQLARDPGRRRRDRAARHGTPDRLGVLGLEGGTRRDAHLDGDGPGRGLRPRRQRAAPALAPERRLAGAGPARRRRSDELPQQGRHRDPRLPGEAAGLRGGPPLSDDPAHPRRPDLGRTTTTSSTSSSGSCSPPTATSSSRPILAAARAAARSSRCGIFADWGHKDAQDVLAAVDDAVRARASPIPTVSASAAGATAAFSPTT